MEEAILTFSDQFRFSPEIVNAETLSSKYSAVIVMGMGGSHLCAGVLRDIRPDLPLIVHNDYGLPRHLPKDLLKNALFIASSYSGNTEETLDALRAVHEAGYAVAGLTTGGALLEYVEENSLPHIVVPDTGIQPRSALGYFVKSLAALMKDEGLMEELSRLADTIDPATLREEGRAVAERLRGSIPLIYTTTRYASLAYNWKIKFNETGKRPAFHNLFSELNHNEMTGFDVTNESRAISDRFHVLMLRGSEEHPQNMKRIETTDALYRDRGIASEIITLTGESVAKEIFRSLVVADWAALYSAAQYGAEPEEVPMIEEFKKRIA